MHPDNIPGVMKEPERKQVNEIRVQLQERSQRQLNVIQAIFHVTEPLRCLDPRQGQMSGRAEILPKCRT